MLDFDRPGDYSAAKIVYKLNSFQVKQGGKPIFCKNLSYHETTQAGIYFGGMC